VSEENDEEKPYEPSQKRLEDARKRGEIPYSADLTTAASYGGLVIVVTSLGSMSMLALGSKLAFLLGQSDKLSSDLLSGAAGPFAGAILASIGWSLMIWIGTPAALAVISILAQQGLRFAGTKLEPKLSRISPISTIRSKFGLTGLVDFAKSIIKLGLYAIAAVNFFKVRMGEIIGTAALGPGPAMEELLRLTTELMLVMFAVSLGIGILDLAWQRLDHLRKNRMSRQELIEEMKDSEGDPATKQQRRARGIGIAMNKMLSDVQKSDVIIVNPTHYAVALKWERGSRRAPVCVAKGTDEIAARIREIAAEHGIPIQLDPPTARLLHARVDVGQEIAHEHFRAVAAAIRFAEGLRKRVKE